MIHCIVADKPVVVPLLEHLEKARNDAIVRDTDRMGILFPEHGRRLLQSVVRDLDEEVVDLMRANVVHEVVSPAIVAVHRAEVAADKVPLLVDVPGHVLVLVAELCI